jgi:hypothetical protein
MFTIIVTMKIADARLQLQLLPGNNLDEVEPCFVITITTGHSMYDRKHSPPAPAPKHQTELESKHQCDRPKTLHLLQPKA